MSSPSTWTVTTASYKDWKLDCTKNIPLAVLPEGSLGTEKSSNIFKFLIVFLHTQVHCRIHELYLYSTCIFGHVFHQNLSLKFKPCFSIHMATSVLVSLFLMLSAFFKSWWPSLEHKKCVLTAVGSVTGEQGNSTVRVIIWAESY